MAHLERDEPNEDGSDYAERQAGYARRYVVDFDEFFAKLSPRQRARYEKAGIIGAILDGAGDTDRDEDPSDKPAASYSVDVAKLLDTLSEKIAEKFSLPSAVAVPLAGFMARTIELESLRYKGILFDTVCGEFLLAKNTKLLAAGLSFAANLGALNGIKSQRKFAKSIHVTPAALSKVTKAWQIKLGLPPSPHQKSQASCLKYKACQTGEKHWRKATFKAGKIQSKAKSVNGKGRSHV